MGCELPYITVEKREHAFKGINKLVRRILDLFRYVKSFGKQLGEALFRTDAHLNQGYVCEQNVTHVQPKLDPPHYGRKKRSTLQCLH